jgi:hypothetical protein
VNVRLSLFKSRGLARTKMQLMYEIYAIYW